MCVCVSGCVYFDRKINVLAICQRPRARTKQRSKGLATKGKGPRRPAKSRSTTSEEPCPRRCAAVSSELKLGETLKIDRVLHHRAYPQSQAPGVSEHLVRSIFRQEDKPWQPR